jgi:uncharacterized protein DUF6782
VDPWLCDACGYLNADGNRCASCGRRFNATEPVAKGRKARAAGNARAAIKIPWQAVVVVLVVVLAGDGLALAGPLKIKTSEAVKPVKAPAQWDARVLPIVNFVEKARGLSYKHPVPVRFLTAAQYSKETRTSGSASAADKVQEKKYEGELRAIGLVPHNTDLAQAGDELADTGTVAFYDDEKKEIVIRGTEMTVSLRVTLAHELTHVLQDQNFGTNRDFDTSGEDTAFTALVEGDADRIESMYVDQLSAADSDAYDSESNNDNGPPPDVPVALEQLFAAPYTLGDAFVEFLVQARGVAGLDIAMRTPPTNEAALFDPFTFLDGQKVTPVAPPKLGSGERKIDDGDFGSVSWFLMLASHIDARVALKAVDGWAGDAYTGYQSAGRTCMRMRFVGVAASDGDEMAAALTSWSAVFPAGTATITHDGPTVDLQSCDQGASMPAPGSGIENALVLPAARTTFATGSLAAHLSEPVARCVAAHSINAYTADQLAADELPKGAPDPRTVGIQAGQACKNAA